jgi:hypothetical protein
MESCREGAHNTRERLLRSRQGLLSANQGARSQGRKAPWGHTTPIVARRLAEAKSKGELDLTILGIRVSAIDRQDEAAN